MTGTAHSVRIVFSMFWSSLPSLQVICIAFFSLEVFSRMAVSPSKKAFFLDMFNWVDLVAVVPFYVETALSDAVRRLLNSPTTTTTATATVFSRHKALPGPFHRNFLSTRTDTGGPKHA